MPHDRSLFGMRGEAVLNRLKVGELTAEKLPVIVLDHPVLTALEDATGAGSTESWASRFSLASRPPSITTRDEMSFEPISYQVRDLLKELPDRLMGPKVAQRHVVAPSGLWGLRLGEHSRKGPIRRVWRSRRFWTDQPPPEPGSNQVTCFAR